jgi:hypothetical protein
MMAAFRSAFSSSGQGPTTTLTLFHIALSVSPIFAWGITLP